MNDKDSAAIIRRYLAEVTAKFKTNEALEHAYRPAFERLMESFPDTHAINDPKRSEHGAPDFIFKKISSPRIIQGYAEAKDLDGDLGANQIQSYTGRISLIVDSGSVTFDPQGLDRATLMALAVARHTSPRLNSLAFPESKLGPRGFKVLRSAGRTKLPAHRRFRLL